MQQSSCSSACRVPGRRRPSPAIWRSASSNRSARPDAPMTSDPTSARARATSDHVGAGPAIRRDLALATWGLFVGLALLLMAGGLFSTMLGVRAELAGLPTVDHRHDQRLVLPRLRRRLAADAARARRGGSHPRVRRAGRCAVGGDAGCRPDPRVGCVGGAAAGHRAVLRRSVRGRRVVVERPGDQRQPRSAAGRVHGGRDRCVRRRSGVDLRRRRAARDRVRDRQHPDVAGRRAGHAVGGGGCAPRRDADAGHVARPGPDRADRAGHLPAGRRRPRRAQRAAGCVRHPCRLPGGPGRPVRGRAQPGRRAVAVADLGGVATTSIGAPSAWPRRSARC